MRFGPSSPNIRFSGGNQEFSPVFKEAHEKAQNIFREKQINMDDFSKLYGEDTVNADKKRLERIKSEFESNRNERGQEAKKVADVFEAIILDKGEEHEWLGKGVKFIKTTEYDDVFGGIDSIAQYNLAGGFEANIGLAIDVTFGHGAQRKLDKIRSKIMEGKSGRVKYFSSGNFKGEKTNVPRVVVGADKLVVEGLARLWVDNDPIRSRHLVNHPIQYQMIEMVLIQAQAFEKFALRNGQVDIAKSYEQIVALLEKINKEKHVKGNLDVQERDRVYRDVVDFTQHGLY